MKLKRIEVKNFKSLRDCSIDLRDFNVVVGPNASGKTNLVEVFKLLRKIYMDEDPFPFLDWWGYDNVVWEGKEELPMTIKLFFESNGYNLSFETVFTGLGGKFQILKEVFEVKDIIIFERERDWMSVRHDKKFFDQAWEKIQQRKIEGTLFDQVFNQAIKEGRDNLTEQKIRTGEDAGIYGKSLRMGHFQLTRSHENFAISLIRYSKIPPGGMKMVEFDTFALEPMIPTEKEDMAKEKPLSQLLIEELWEFVNKIIILKGLDIRKMKEPYKERKEVAIFEDGSNVCNVLYNLFLKENKIPERINQLLSYTFPDTSLRFDLTQDGRILFKVFEGNLELSSPSISDGFYKFLTILTALESKPSLLVEDEVENSLHAEILRIIIGELKTSECNVILTTHSPVVVDLVKPEDLILVDKGGEGTNFKRIEKPEVVRKQLSERGITLSDRWLYGKL